MPKKRGFKRLLACGDSHCGSLVGLTPPDWQVQFPTRSKSKRAKVAKYQRAMWEWFQASVEALQPIDALLVNGDAIDGKGRRSGGTESLAAARTEQTDMAADWIEMVKADTVVMTYGTPYHTGQEEDWEDIVAGKVCADKIGGHEWLELNGVVFDCKHTVGSSQIPHGRHTAVARERMWNRIWSDRKYPKATILLRSHVHYFQFAGDQDGIGMTLPALQGPGSKYGVRQCSGTVDFGFVTFDVDQEGGYSWEPHLLDVQEAPVKPLKV